MEPLNGLVKDLEALKESEGDFNIGLDLELNDLIGVLLQTAQYIDEVDLTLKARKKDVERKEKKVTELESSLNAQRLTIEQQSETLENRQLLVDKQGDAMVLLQEAIEAKAKAPSNIDQLTIELCTGLQLYGVRLAELAQENNTAHVAVHVIQLANTLSKLGPIEGVDGEPVDDFKRCMHWLTTGQ